MKPLSLKKLLPKLYFPILLVYLECIFRAFIIKTPPLLTFLCQLGLSIAIGACLGLICSLFTAKINGIVSVFFSTIFTLWFLTQVVYISVFQTPLILSSIGGAGQILQFIDVILQTILRRMRGKFHIHLNLELRVLGNIPFFSDF